MPVTGSLVKNALGGVTERATPIHLRKHIPRLFYDARRYKATRTVEPEGTDTSAPAPGGVGVGSGVTRIGCRV